MAVSKKNTLNKKNSAAIPQYRNIFSYALICVIFAALFAVRLHIENLSGNSLLLFSNSEGLYADWFLYCKEIIFLLCAIASCLYFVGERIFPDSPCRINPIFESKAKLPMILISIYFIMSIASAVFSQNKDVVLWGMCNEFEGIIGIFTYCVLFTAGYNFFSGRKIRRFYKRAFLVLIIVTAVLAAFEYFSTPILELPFMKYIIAPEEYRNLAENITKSNTFREAVLMFYNSNYMGGFCTIIFPVSLYYIIAAEKNLHKILYSILAAGTFAAGIMSNSTAAFYVMIVEGIFIFAIFTAKKIIRFRSSAIILGSAVIVIAAASLFSENEFIGNIIKSATNSGTYTTEENDVFRLNKINIVDNSVVFSGNNFKSEYKVTPPFNKNEKLKIIGLNDTAFKENKIDQNQITVTDAASGKNISIVLNNGILYLDFGYKSTVDFAVTTNGLKAIVQNANLINEIPQAPFNNSSLSKYYRLATGRGYIWLNTLPILKDCLIIGKGAGNFPFYFTQNDIVGLSETNGSYHIIVDKPHNWYLQIAVTSGFPAAISIIVLFGIFVFSCGRKILKTHITNCEKDNNTIFLVCLYTGLLGFMTMGLVNDSIMAVNPFFWFNFGIAYFWSNSCGEERE